MRDGTKNLNRFYKFLYRFTLLSWIIVGCTTQANQDEIDDLALDSNEESDSEESEDDSKDGKENHIDKEGSISIEDSKDLPHPKKPTAFSTRVLVTSSKLPDAGKISQCFEEIFALAKSNVNREDLRRAQLQLSKEVLRNLALYHFCFYSKAADLDTKLNQSTSSLSDLASQFFATYRGLWILSRALDVATDQKIYFPYLRQRYMQISQEYFGRHLEIYDPDEDSERGPRNRSPKGNKPAHRSRTRH